MKTIDLSLYEPEIECETTSILSGEHKEKVHYKELPDIPVIQAWLADDDLQVLKVASTNFGFVRAFQKVFRKPHQRRLPRLRD